MSMPVGRETRRRVCGLVIQATLGLQLAQAFASQTTTTEVPMESAKRRAPTAKPVTYSGTRYEQLRRPQEHGFTQGGGIIGAIDVASGRMLWAVQLYETPFDPKEERDVQEVYVSELSIDKKASALIAVDERKRRWQVLLSDHSVTQLPPQKR